MVISLLHHGGTDARRAVSVTCRPPAAPLAWSRLRADGERSRLATLLLVVDGEGRDVLAGRGEAEDLGVEVELRVERVLDVLGLAEAVLLALVDLERTRQPLLELRLVGRHDLVLVALQQQDRARELLDRVDRRAR